MAAAIQGIQRVHAGALSASAGARSSACKSSPSAAAAAQWIAKFTR